MKEDKKKYHANNIVNTCRVSSTINVNEDDLLFIRCEVNPH